MAPAPEDKERLAQHSADVARFIELLVAATSESGSRANVVMTVRADFYNPLIRNSLLAARLPKQQVNIPPMSRDDLRSAIETPAKTAGLSFAPPQLVDRILDDVGVEEGRLPLLQFALKETWAKREGDRLTAEAYTEVGGVAGAIEKTAQDAYERLTPSQKDAARRLFLRLVTPGEGQADTRARSAIPDDPEQRGIVSLFANPKTRLLVTGYETVQGSARTGSEARSTVEVAHEALIQRWPTLRDWVRANRENLRARAAILRAKTEWEEKGESGEFLLDPGVQLERGRALLANPGDVAVDDIRDYVARAIAKDERRVDAEREADLAAEKRIADAERQAREAAERAALEATARAEAERQARAIAEKLAIEEAARAEAHSRAREAADEFAREAQARAEAERMAKEAAEQTATEQKKAAIAGRRTAQVAIAGLTVALLVAAAAVWQYFNAREAARLAELATSHARASAEEAKDNLSEAQIAQSRFLADLAARKRAEGDAGTTVLLALEALPDDAGGASRPYVPEAELQLDSGWRDLRERLDLGHDGAVWSAAFSPDGKRIVTASWDKTARVWDAATGQPIGEPLKGHDGAVWSAAFSPDGKRIVTTSADKTARVWDAATGQPIGEPLKGHEGAVLGAAFSPDGKRIVTASDDKTARVWDVFPDTQALVSAAKAAVPRCLTLAQRKAFYLSSDPPAWCVEKGKWPFNTAEWEQWLRDLQDGENPPLPAGP
jgi:hypothetical protein